MHRRTWDAETKTKIVIQGLQGRPVAELCNEYQIRSVNPSTINGATSFSRMRRRPLTSSKATGKRPA
jgi:hypothetical protein